MAGMQSPVGEQPTVTDRHTYALRVFKLDWQKGYK